MLPFLKRKNLNFNAVIEGSFQEGWKTLYYKLARLEVPQDVSVLNDKTYRYQLYGKTEDFNGISIAVGNGLEAKVPDLADCHGIVLSNESDIEFMLERPRAVCMRDGRIFVDINMMEDAQYMDAMFDVVRNAGRIFQSGEYLKTYRTAMRHFKGRKFPFNISLVRRV